MATVVPSTNTAAQGWRPKGALEGREPKWDLAFLGVLFYLVIEYTRLPAMFPVLQALQLGKVAVLLGVIGMLFSKRAPSSDPAASLKIDLAVMAFTFVTLFSVLFAINPMNALLAFIDMLRWAVLVFLISRVLATRWRLRWALILIILLNVKLAQFQLRTYHSELEWGRSEQFLARGVGAGSTGFFANSNDFGIAMAVAWPLAGMALMAERNRLLKLVLFVGFLVISGALLFSASRGSLVGAAAAALFAWLRNPKRLLGPVLVMLLAGGAVLFLPQAHKDRIISMVNFEQDGNARTRLHLWGAGLKMFAEHPLLGVGIGNYRDAYVAMYGGERDYVLVPHSIYIQALSETGILGTISVTLIFLFCLRLNAKTAKRMVEEGDKGSYYNQIAVGLNLAWVAYLVNGAFLTVLYYPHAWILAGLTIGLHTATSTSAIPPRSRKPQLWGPLR